MAGSKCVEILGCKILQSPKSEKEAISEMSSALKNGKVCKVDVTNFKEDGSFFRNLVCLKTVCDKLKVPRFVVGIQHDITGEGISATRIKYDIKSLFFLVLLFLKIYLFFQICRCALEPDSGDGR